MRIRDCILIFHGSNYNIDEAYVDSVLDQFESGDMVVLQGKMRSILPTILLKKPTSGA